MKGAKNDLIAKARQPGFKMQSPLGLLLENAKLQPIDVPPWSWPMVMVGEEDLQEVGLTTKHSKERVELVRLMLISVNMPKSIALLNSVVRGEIKSAAVTYNQRG